MKGLQLVGHKLIFLKRGNFGRKKGGNFAKKAAAFFIF
jgi:hypothetical protein